jgi:hypothetical protein
VLDQVKYFDGEFNLFIAQEVNFSDKIGRFPVLTDGYS